MANKFQVKRTTVTSRTPNTTNSGNTHFIDTGELALNLTDGKMFSSNGTVYFEVGANVVNQNVTGNATISSIIANGTIGTDGQVLKSNGSIIYWDSSSGSGTVTQVSTGDGLAGGPITTAGTISVIANNGIIANSTGLFANAGTGLVVNATGIHVNSSYIGTLSSNNASNLGGVAAASYLQNTDSRTLSGNLVISGTYFNPSANTIFLGNSTQRWVISANTGNFSGAVNGITTLAAGNTTITGFVNATSTIQGGSSLTIAGSASGITTLAAGNTTVTGFVNATSTIQGGSSLTIAGAASGITTLAAGNTTVTGFVNATSSIQGGSSLTIAGAASGITTLAAGNTTITGFANVTTSVNSAALSVGTSFIANTSGAYHTGIVNAASHTTSGFVANTTAIVPTSNTILLGNTIGRFVLSANTGDFTGAITSSGGVNPASNSTGTTLGSSTARWVLNANSGNFTANIAMNSNYVTGLSDPVGAQDAATKAYVDTFAQGLHVHESCAAATPDTLATLTGGLVTYDNGTAGVGATLTLAVALTTLDGYTLVNGDRIMVKNQANAAHNGIYSRTSSTVLTRSTDFDTGAEVAGGDFTFVTNGTLYNSTGWVQLDQVTTMGTDAIAFQQFSGQGTFTAGQYLYLTGSQFNANATSASTASVLIARDASQNFAANTATLNSLSSANATFSGPVSGITNLAAGNTTITGFANVSTSVNSAIISVGTSFIANSSQLTISGIPLSANGATGTAGHVLHSNGATGSPYWAADDNSGGTVTSVAGTGTVSGLSLSGTVTTSGSLTLGGSISGALSGITTLAAGNTTLTGFANVTTSIQGGSSLTIAGAASGITTLAAGNTTITGFADVSTSVNSAILSVGSNFIANTSQVTLAAGVLLSANGGVGTAGQVLYSNGATGSPYWAADGVASVTDDTTTNGNRYILFANQTSSTLSTSYVSSTKMYFNPSTGKLNATSFNSLSDSNKKENIQTLQDATSKVLKMRGVSFTWKGTNDKSIGLIAQEVEKILPEVVSTCEDGVKSISYDSIVGLLVEAFKEQQKTIDSLKDTINILSKNNNMDGDSK
jgi:hypothetical protein